MASKRNTERLDSARPTVMPTTVAFSKLSIQKLYARCRQQSRAAWNDGLEYADFINALWNSMLTSPSCKEEAVKVEETLGRGDTIQILSDIFLEDRNAQSAK
ncbi:MAG: hypothetical protein ACI828_000706 [Flavobacteriales bacterium]|jgi:hypothetical protein